MNKETYEPRPPLKGADRPGHQVRRFWQTVSTGPYQTGFAVFLDGKVLQTPLKQPAILPTQGLTDLIATEWQAIEGLVEPSAMPFSRLGFSAIDRLKDREAETIKEALAYYETDLLAYPSPYPTALKRVEEEHWEPVRSWLIGELGLDFQLSETLGARTVSDDDRQKLIQATAGLTQFARSGFMLSLSYLSSWSLAFALYRGFLKPETALRAATVGEAFQAKHWGEDPEALDKRQSALMELSAIAQWYEAL
jgi:chaperone required for assembly of F1-ATPase